MSRNFCAFNLKTQVLPTYSPFSISDGVFLVNIKYHSYSVVSDPFLRTIDNNKDATCENVFRLVPMLIFYTKFVVSIAVAECCGTCFARWTWFCRCKAKVALLFFLGKTSGVANAHGKGPRLWQKQFSIYKWNWRVRRFSLIIQSERSVVSTIKCARSFHI